MRRKLSFVLMGSLVFAALSVAPRGALAQEACAKRSEGCGTEAAASIEKNEEESEGGLKGSVLLQAETVPSEGVIEKQLGGKAKWTNSKGRGASVEGYARIPSRLQIPEVDYAKATYHTGNSHSFNLTTDENPTGRLSTVGAEVELPRESSAGIAAGLLKLGADDVESATRYLGLAGGKEFEMLNGALEIEFEGQGGRFWGGRSSEIANKGFYGTGEIETEWFPRDGRLGFKSELELEVASTRRESGKVSLGVTPAVYGGVILKLNRSAH